jgi:hypothetical protein
MPETNPCFDCGQEKPVLFSTRNNDPGAKILSVSVCVPCFNKRNHNNQIKE